MRIYSPVLLSFRNSLLKKALLWIFFPGAASQLRMKVRIIIKTAKTIFILVGDAVA